MLDCRFRDVACSGNECGNYEDCLEQTERESRRRPSRRVVRPIDYGMSDEVLDHIDSGLYDNLTQDSCNEWDPW